MERNVKISVIIPLFNACNTISRAVNSVLMQKFEELEIILVDDGSSDGSSSICDMLAQQDARVRAVHKENGGVSSARNRGIEEAQGEYLMFLDADDAIREGALARLYLPGWDMILGGFAKMKDGSVVESYQPSEDADYVDIPSVSSFLDRTIDKKHSYLLNSACFKLIRRSLIMQNSIRFDEDLKYAEDKIFVFSVLCHTEKVRTISDIVYDYILQSGSLSSDVRSDMHLKQIFCLLERYAPLLEKLVARYGSSKMTASLYHSDLVGRYVARILTEFSLRDSELMDRDSISLLYGYMSDDKALGLFSIRPGQILNILLFKIGKPETTISFYRFSSRISRYISSVRMLFEDFWKS